MSNHAHQANPSGNSGYEHRDVGVSGVLYFLAGLALAGLIVYFVVEGLYGYLNRRSEQQQTSVSPLVANAPADTRRLPAKYGADYEKYLKDAFPAPQLEVNEQTELGDVRTKEEETLSTYDYVDKNAGTVRIPIDRAMDLIVQRGLPVREQSSTQKAAAKETTKK